MLGWAFLFLILAIVFGVLGYSGIAGAFAWVSITLFVIMLAIAIVLFIYARRAISKIT